jgi:hypothetical protein
MPDSDNVVDALRRWALFGGRWQVLTRSESVVTIGLFTCDGGQEMSRLTAMRSDFDAFLASRRGRDRPSDDRGPSPG